MGLSRGGGEGRGGWGVTVSGREERKHNVGEVAKNRTTVVGAGDGRSTEWKWVQKNVRGRQHIP